LLVAGCGYTIGFTAPELVAPANGTTIACLAPDTDDSTGYLFVWRAVPNAITYMLEIYDATGTTLVGAQTITGSPPPANAVHPESALACGASYQWRVGVTFSNTPPGWSGRWTFTIAP
jgi:hypothetical protein